LDISHSLPDSSRGFRFARSLGRVAVLAGLLLSGIALRAQNAAETIDDITASYHFLSTDDTLAILDEEGRLKGYIEIPQPEGESDDFLSYEILEGSRTKNHVTFFTKTIHGKYFRFSGTAERGKGHTEKDPDYLHLTGDLEIVTVTVDANKSDPGKPDVRKETAQTVRVVFKSLGKSERPEG
jgi:hypothetical protein